MQAKSNLRPEDQRAINHVCSLLKKELSVKQIESITSDIWYTNNYQVFSEPIKVRKIPSGPNWRWNQTKSRKTTFLTQHNAEVSFVKLIPRKLSPINNNNNISIPNFKVWSFSITFISKQKQPLYILWCEKGSKTQIEPINEIFHTQKEEFTFDSPSKLYAAKISFICN